MTVNELIDKLDAKAYVLADGERKVVGGYAGDFLSFVMAKAPADSGWFTIMTNVNVAAVAKLSDVSAVIICEGSVPDIPLIEKAEAGGINIISTGLDIFSAIKLF